jgi:hypothetical protein
LIIFFSVRRVNSSQSFFEEERYFQLDMVFQDLPFTIQLDLLVLNPRGLEVLQCFLSAHDTRLYSLIKTPWR